MPFNMNLTRDFDPTSMTSMCSSGTALKRSSFPRRLDILYIVQSDFRSFPIAAITMATLPDQVLGWLYNNLKAVCKYSEHQLYPAQSDLQHRTIGSLTDATLISFKHYFNTLRFSLEPRYTVGRLATEYSIAPALTNTFSFRQWRIRSPPRPSRYRASRFPRHVLQISHSNLDTVRLPARCADSVCLAHTRYGC